jgi:hypothetical protein
MDKAQTYSNLPERKTLAPEYDKAIRIVRRLIIEEFQN